MARAPKRALLGLVLASGALSSFAAVHRHLGFRSSAFDVGVFDQVVWGVGHGNGMRSSLKEGISILGDHFEPILALFAPLYFVWDSPLCLLVFQGFVLASAAIPIFLMARRRLSTTLSLAVAISVLVFLPMRALAIADYHPETAAVPLLAWALWALSLEKAWLFFLTIGLACLCKESTCAAACGIGLAAALFGTTPKERRLGAICALGSGALFVVAVAVVIPHFRGGPNAYVERYSYLGATNLQSLLLAPLRHPIRFAEALVLPPRKIRYLLKLFAPLAFLPLLKPRWIVALAPVLLMNLLSSYPLQQSLLNQYTAELIPVLFAGAIDAADTAWGRRTIRAPVFLLLALVFWGTQEPIGELWQPVTDRHRRIDAVLHQLPSDASVAAQLYLLPHVAHRRDVLLLPELDGAQYAAFDLDEPLLEWNTDRVHNDAQLLGLIASGATIEAEFEGFYLLKLGGPGKAR